MAFEKVGGDFASDDLLVAFHGVSETLAHFCRNFEPHVK